MLKPQASGPREVVNREVLLRFKEDSDRSGHGDGWVKAALADYALRKRSTTQADAGIGTSEAWDTHLFSPGPVPAWGKGAQS